MSIFTRYAEPMISVQINVSAGRISPKSLAVDLCNPFAMIPVFDEDTRTFHIFEICPEALQRALDFFDDKMRLGGGIFTI